MEEIEKQWEQFVQIPFPRNAHDSPLALEALDATIAGCVSNFVQKKTFEKENVTKLQESLETLQSEFEHIPEDAKAYFRELLTMGNFVLKQANNPLS